MGHSQLNYYTVITQKKQQSMFCYRVLWDRMKKGERKCRKGKIVYRLANWCGNFNS